MISKGWRSSGLYETSVTALSIGDHHGLAQRLDAADSGRGAAYEATASPNDIPAAVHIESDRELRRKWAFSAATVSMKESSGMPRGKIERIRNTGKLIATHTSGMRASARFSAQTRNLLEEW